MFVLQFIFALVLGLSDAKRFFITRYGACTDCDFRGYKYQWCSVGTGSSDWDYCSTQEGMSTRNQKCRDDSECDFRGENYLWCYLEAGSWDYCSRIEDTSLVQFATTGEECQNYCDLESGNYVCRKGDLSSSECSIADGATADGGACIDEGGGENVCGRHGYAYNWCWSTGGSGRWGYCSDTQTDSSALEGFRDKRQARSCNGGGGSKMVVLHSIVQRLGGGRRLITSFYRENPNPSNLRLARGDWRRDAHTVIYRWHNILGSDAPTGGTTETRWRTIRLDRQGTTQTVNQGDYMNWQLQINGNAGWPSSVAHVNIPERLQGFSNGRDMRGWRRLLVTALHYSLNEGATVWVVQQRVDRGGNPQCPRRGT